MNKKNITNKSVKPAYVVNITECVDENDVRFEFIQSKVDNFGIIAKDDFEFVKSFMSLDMIQKAIDTFGVINTIVFSALHNTIENNTKQKKPWYKRAWNWLCRKN